MGHKRVVSEPGKVAVDVVDTALGQNNPINPVGLIGNAIRRGIGSAGIKDEGVGVLARERDSQGNIRSGTWDYFLKQGTDELNAAGLKAAQGANEFRAIGDEGYSYVDPTTGKVRTIQDLERGSSRLQNPQTQAALLEGAKKDIDPFKDSQTKITNAGNLAALNNQATADGIVPKNLSNKPGVAKRQLEDAIKDNDWEENQNKEQNSYRETQRITERNQDLTRAMESEASKRNLDLATLSANARQADLDREYLDSRDMREYEYKIQKDDMERMDRVFELILGISKGAF